MRWIWWRRWCGSYSGWGGGWGRGGGRGSYPRFGGGSPSGSQGASVDDDDEDDEDEINENGQRTDNSGDEEGTDLGSSDEDGTGAVISSIFEVLRQKKERKRKIVMLAGMIGTYYLDTYLNKRPRRVAPESGYEWVMRSLGNTTDCYDMFRMYRPVFERLHRVLVDSYGLKTTNKMSSLEALGMFLYIVGAPQSVRQARNRLVRSLETVSRKFNEVLKVLMKLAKDIIKPNDPHFTTVHHKLQSSRYTPYFDNYIGAIDGTHIQVVVPPSKAIQHRNRHKEKTQNVMCVCDFDMRFTFVLAGWPGLVHDMRVFSDAQFRWGHRFPKPPEEKFYLVDSGYPNMPGYLALYKDLTYHFQEYNKGTMPRGKKEHFNYSHSSCRNVIERSFGVLNNKWRILFNLPNYTAKKQSQIIVACCALHNFIRQSQLTDTEFDLCDQYENYDPMGVNCPLSTYGTDQSDSQEMNQFRDWVADGLWSLK